MNELRTVRIRAPKRSWYREAETFTGTYELSVNGVVYVSESFEIIGTNHLTPEQIGSEEYPYLVQSPEFSVDLGLMCWVTLAVSTGRIYGGSAIIEVLDPTRLWREYDPLLPPVDVPGASYQYLPPYLYTGTWSQRFFVGDDYQNTEGCSEEPEVPVDPPDPDPDPPDPDPDPDPGPDPGGPGQGSLEASRQFVTTLVNFMSDEGASRVVAGTRTRLYVDTGDGNWQVPLILTDEDCSGDAEEESEIPFGRFLVDFIGNMLFIAHTQAGFWTWTPGLPFYQNEHGVYISAEPVDDLIALDVREARAVCQSNGFILIGNYVEEGIRVADGVRWSDFNGPRIHTPGGDSLAGYTTLGGEEVLSIVRLGEGVRVLTRMSVWIGAFVGGDEVWRFVRMDDVNPADAIAYPYAITKIGESIVYLGHDAILALDKHDTSPRRIPNLQQASGVIFRGISRKLLSGLDEGLGIATRCPIRRDLPWTAIAVYDATRNLLLFFWASGESSVQDTGLAIDMVTGNSCVLDFGATAGCPVRPVWRTTWRRYLEESGICEAVAEINEGDPVPGTFTPTTASYLVHPDELTGMFPAFDLRDMDLETEAPNSWYVLARAQGRCCIDCPPVSADMQTVLASPVDKCLKALDSSFFSREVVTNTVSPTWRDETAADGSVESVPAEYVGEGDEPPNHPSSEVSEGDVTRMYYGCMWQSDASDIGSMAYKDFRDLAVACSAYPRYACEDPANIGVSVDTDWNIWAQVGSGYSQDSLIWHDDDPQPVPDHYGRDPEDSIADYDGGHQAIAFRFAAAGIYFVIRIGAGGYADDGPEFGPLTISDATSHSVPLSCIW